MSEQPSPSSSPPDRTEELTHIEGDPERPTVDANVEWPTVPGYEILGEIGRGGMGVVYRAQQISLSRIVALKMLRDRALANEKQLARFRTEAASVARLQHPNIVQIHALHDEGGLPFFAMEYVPGGNLAQLLEKRPLAPRQAAELAEILARAVHFAHQQGILHRDLKPANILIADAEGNLPEHPNEEPATVKITDFGLAKQLDEDLSNTPTLSIMGTPAYMAPEQAERSKTLGPPTDVHALGSILYEMLTGRPPFDGESTLRILDQVRFSKPVPPREIRKDIPPDLETICLRCLEKDPEARYSTAAALAEDLQRYLQGQPPAKPGSKSGPQEKSLAGYEIREEVARGGLWVVFRAWDKERERLVALKRLRSGSSPSPEQLAQLRKTLRRAARLDHPRIVPILDHGGEGEELFLTMPLLDGVTLEKRGADEPPSPTRAAELLVELAEAVDHAHQKGLLHCHLVMRNVIMEPDEEGALERPVLIGFEMAQLRDEKSTHVLSTIRPTSHAMAPEQLFSQPEKIGPATDIYSLGIILYELLAHRPPYQARTTSDLLLKVGFEILKAPHRHNPEVPESLSNICMKCIQVDPALRYRSGAELAEDLRAFLEGRPTSADRKSLWRRAWHWLRARFRRDSRPLGMSGE